MAGKKIRLVSDYAFNTFISKFAQAQMMIFLNTLFLNFFGSSV